MPLTLQSKKAFMRIPRFLRAGLYYLIQWTWGLPQNLAGLTLLALMGRQKRVRCHGAAVTLFDENRFMPQNGAVSLGMFIFIPLSWGEEMCRQTAVHEYGHSIQSLILGPFYLFAIGLPSIIWAHRWSKSQMTRLPEPPEKSAFEADAANNKKAPKRTLREARAQKKLQRRIKLKGVRYTSRYPENWANLLGEYATGEKPSEH